jgi:dipeptidyl aminopeptidase/acylaminoacyl peptidase
VSRKVVLSLISVLLITAAALAASRLLNDDQSAQATLFHREGHVTVTEGSGSSWSALGVLKVAEGDRIETGANSRAFLAFSPGATAEFGSYTQALVSRLILADNDAVTIKLGLLKGETWHRLSPLMDPEAQYEVVTPSATAILAAGRYHVTVGDDGSTRVEVSEGTARVEALNSVVEVRAGEYTSATLGRSPSVPRPLEAQFLFVSEREGSADIWLRQVDGHESNLTGSLADDLAPAWSPDGDRIAFETIRDANREIYVMSADGSHQVNISGHPADDGAPAWSPDGTTIAFESRREGQEEIYLMNADGSEQLRLTTGPGLKLTPSWSEDGKEIVFTRIPGDSNADGVIDSSDMGAVFCLDVESGSVRACEDGKTVFDQMIFPWGRRRVG